MCVLSSSPLTDTRFSAFFANAATAIAVIDLSGLLLQVNPAFCRISGYAPDEISGIGFDVFAGHERDHFAKLVAGVIPGYVVERRYPRKDGSHIWFRNSVSLIRGPQNEPICAMAIMEDLTEKKALQELARQSHKMEALGRLAGGVAHDFNNLLMIINSYASLLKEELGPETPAGGRAHAIEEAGTRAAVLTRQLLAFSRKQVLQTQVISLDELIRSSEQMLRRLIRENIAFTCELDAGDACIDADLGQIQQVLMNLAVNASDAMPNGGSLALRTGTIDIDGEPNGTATLKAGHYVWLSVADTGVGMDATTRERIFEPFFTTKEAGKGTGLGLATVHGIIDQSDGLITVDSAPGQGTAFNIYLPVVAREADSSTAEAPSPSSRKRLDATILLVEDEDILRRCLLNTLSAMGCFVLQAPDGQHAMNLARRQLLLIDLVVTDMVMPNMGGRDLVTALRSIRPQLPVIFMSGYTDSAPTREELRSGITRYFQKPFNTDHLRKAVEEILAAAPAHRAR